MPKGVSRGFGLWSWLSPFTSSCRALVFSPGVGVTTSASWWDPGDEGPRPHTYLAPGSAQ